MRATAAARSWLGLALPWWPWHRPVAFDVGGRAVRAGISRIHLIAPITESGGDMATEVVKQAAERVHQRGDRESNLMRHQKVSANGSTA
jgi:hypothetical protein